MLEYDEAIAFFNKYAIEHDVEIKLYVLVRLLFEDKQQEAIQSVLKDAIKVGIKPRSSLNKLLATIQKTGELPQYIG